MPIFPIRLDDRDEGIDKRRVILELVFRPTANLARDVNDPIDRIENNNEGGKRKGGGVEWIPPGTDLFAQEGSPLTRVCPADALPTIYIKLELLEMIIPHNQAENEIDEKFRFS